MREDGIFVFPLDEGVTPDNVLTYALGLLKDVTLVGKGLDGKMYFATSIDHDDYPLIAHRLRTFEKELEDV